MSRTPLLDTVKYPSDLKKIPAENLQRLADELRYETIDSISSIGGHLGAGLGVVELTVALHYVFDTPNDKVIWDVGHQAYPHKILTGRRDKIRTIRQPEGLSPFTKRAESEYDPFGAGHSSTSISAGLGMAVARDLKGDDFEVVSVIGDGAMSAGMAYEAMNNAGALKNKMIVILNDNDMSIAPAVGAMSAYLSKLISSGAYLNFRNVAKNVASHLPKSFENAAKGAEKYARNLVTGGNFFEEMGFYYIGPINGHNIDHLLPVLQNIKDDDTVKHPVLVHVVTEKGRGFNSPDQSEEKFHAVSKFNSETKVQMKPARKAITYTNCFAESLVYAAKHDDKVVAITAAMPSGTGLDKFSEAFPERTFDVGIAEQHAVTFAAGLATEGYKPFVAIYSTFLQRAYDQIVHDVAIQKLPVRFAIDRAGLVGADGSTHAGSFDLSYLCNLPSFVIMAPSDEQELANMVATSVQINDAPSAIRYPRGEALGLESLNTAGYALPIGKGRIVREGKDIAILSLGTCLSEATQAADILSQHGYNITIADARFAKPLDKNLIDELAETHSTLITIEEGATGGFSSHVADYLSNNGLLDSLKFRAITLPDIFITHNTQENMRQQAGISAKNIIKIINEVDNKIAVAV